MTLNFILWKTLLHAKKWTIKVFAQMDADPVTKSIPWDVWFHSCKIWRSVSGIKIDSLAFNLFFPTIKNVCCFLISKEVRFAYTYHLNVYCTFILWNAFGAFFDVIEKYIGWTLVNPLTQATTLISLVLMGDKTKS